MKIFSAFATAAGLACAMFAAHAATTWFGYGRATRRRRRDATDPLLDRFTPEFDVYERHAITVAAPPGVTFAAAKQMQLESSPTIRAIFKARALLMGAKAAPPSPPRGFLDQMKAIGWGPLAELPDREVVMGAVTKPWEPNPVFRPLPPEDFAAFAEPDHVKIAWTIAVSPTPDGGSAFRTETRAVAIGAGARRKFRLYWSVLSPGIILIRSVMVRALKTAAERLWRIEGDDILANARAELTHAAVIDAPAADVWPWLLQMGCQRAGWYSWDRLDNAGVPSADRIIPALQHLSVGDVLPARPVGAEGFKVLRIVPERALVLGGTSPRWGGTWAFVLEPLGEDGKRTRLITRYRAAYPPSPRMSILVPVLAAVHRFMERKQLRTIKARVEMVRAA
jgi:hypothetical protein